jgi:enamine deaminase RidA (YjgF/YER057c/UK114 family)
MGHIQPLSPVTIAGTDVCFAQGVKAGNWVFLTGHEATDFATGLTPEVRGKSKFPLYGAPKHRREGDFILRRLETLLQAAGTDRAHAVRLDQYYPTWKAVDPYHDARRAYFGDYIPPSTSVLMPELLHPDADINTSMIAVMPGERREVRRVSDSYLVAPTGSGFAPVVTSGDYVFMAGQMAHHGGQVGIDPSAHVPDAVRWSGTEIKLQADFIIKELIRPALTSAGSSLANVIKAQVYLAHVEDFPLFMEVWNGYFGAHPCALSVIPTAAFGAVEGMIEINVMALKDEGVIKKEIVACDIPPTMACGPPAVRAGDLLLLSGLIATDDAGAIAGIEAGAGMPYHAASSRSQMYYLLETAQRICQAAGTSLDNVVRAHQFHTDLREFYPMYTVWREVLSDQPIPFGAVRVPAPMPAPGCTVMMDLWVYAPSH